MYIIYIYIYIHSTHITNAHETGLIAQVTVFELQHSSTQFWHVQASYHSQLAQDDLIKESSETWNVSELRMFRFSKSNANFSATPHGLQTGMTFWGQGGDSYYRLCLGSQWCTHWPLWLFLRNSSATLQLECSVHHIFSDNSHYFDWSKMRNTVQGQIQLGCLGIDIPLSFAPPSFAQLLQWSLASQGMPWQRIRSVTCSNFNLPGGQGWDLLRSSKYKL